MTLKKSLIFILVLLHVVVLWKIKIQEYVLGNVQLWDFDVYYQTAKDVIAGMNPYQLPYMQTAGPPLVIAPFLIFTFFNLQSARILITFLSLVATFGTSYLLSQLIFKKAPLIFALILNLIFIILFQTRFNLLLGQPNLLLMYAVTVMLTQSNTRMSMLLASITVIFKTHYIFSFISMLQNAKMQLTQISLLLLLLVAITIPIIKIENYTYYLTTRLEQHIGEPLVIHDVGYYNQSLRATLARFEIPNTFLIITIFLFLIGAYCTYTTEDMGLGIILSLMISPVVWQHYTVLTYPILFITILAYIRQNRLPWHIIIAAILLCSHIPWLHEKPVTMITGLLASHYYVGYLLLFYSRFSLLMTVKRHNTYKLKSQLAQF